MKLCIDCGKNLPLEMFKENRKYLDGHKRVCRICDDKRPRLKREWTIKKGAVKPLNNKKAKARQRVSYAVSNGLLVPSSTCQVCGIASKSIEAHHPDYDKPLFVTWLCKQCHKCVHELPHMKATKDRNCTEKDLQLSLFDFQ
jgi:hypothetical protein